MKEQDPAVTIHLVTVGEADAEPIIRKALALGGDEAIRINIQSNDSFVVANQIAVTGKETIDYNSACIGSMLSGLLDLPYVSLANQMTLNGNTASVKREIEGGEETCEVTLPAIVSCQKGMAEQRIPNMRGIMAARTKPLKVVEPIAVQATTSIKNYDLPPAKSGVKLVAADNVEELVRLLKEEAKAF
jgi:electron transfer flavoprotein beta subunit